jgi:SAM-dependent methyltransferase
MPHSAPDFRRRAELTELMDGPCSREVLRGCLRDMVRLNRWMMGYRPWFDWLDGMVHRVKEPMRILDVGCGNGDGLRRIAAWAVTKNIPVALTGVDLNPDAVSIAAAMTPVEDGIEFACADVFNYTPRQPFDLILSSLFTHHLRDADVVRFLGWMERQATLGWLVNDLSRAAVPYYALRIFSRVAGLHPFVQNDGPVSIARAFQREDWQRLCAAAGLGNGAVSIRAYKPARLCVARSKIT